MSATRTRPRRSTRPTPTPHKPRGYFHDRVQQAEPAHFGLACFDCHKDYSQWMLADFFGHIHLTPRRLDHPRPALGGALALLRRTAQEKGLTDLLAVVERTGRYHRTAQHALRLWTYGTTNSTHKQSAG